MKKLKPGWRGIVKVQQALNNPGYVLIYTGEDRDGIYEGPGDKELLKHMGKRPKVFYMAEVTTKMKWRIHINEKVDQNQNW